MFTWIERNMGPILGFLLFIAVIVFWPNLSKFERMKYPQPEFRKNFHATVEAMNANEPALTNDKFHRPTTCNVVLFKVIKENKYFTINSCSLSDGDFHIDDAWMYNHKVGDTAYFKHLKTKRFFHIKDRK